MRTKFLQLLIETAVPFLNTFRSSPEWHYSHQELRGLPKESIGFELSAFLDRLQLTLLPKYEVHDLLHVLLQYGTSPKEEMMLQGFMLGNGSASFGGKVLFTIGLIIKPEYFPAVRQEWKRGKRARPVHTFNFHKLVTYKTRTLQHRLQIPMRSNSTE
mgnify:CR=1 FL=1